MKKGLVHIYTGGGKGKTTAALGLCLRAIGCGLKVCFFQFFKDRKFPCSEARAVRYLGKNFKFVRFDIPHPFFKKIDTSKLGLKLKDALREVDKAIKSREFDLIVLDEILIGLRQGFIEEKTILEIIENRPRPLELVMTGRGASETIINAADYVTCMEEVRHPFKKGLGARKGIEF